MKKNIINKALMLAMCVIAIMCTINTKVYARTADELGIGGPEQQSTAQTHAGFDGLSQMYDNVSDEAYENIGGKIIGTAQYICYGVAVIILVYKGVMLMKSAPEAKADAKKELITYAIGALILCGVVSIIRIVGELALGGIFKI